MVFAGPYQHVVAHPIRTSFCNIPGGPGTPASGKVSAAAATGVTYNTDFRQTEVEVSMTRQEIAHEVELVTTAWVLTSRSSHEDRVLDRERERERRRGFWRARLRSFRPSTGTVAARRRGPGRPLRLLRDQRPRP